MLVETNAVMLGPRYRLLNTLGSGGMGTVYKAVDRLTGHTVALKQVLTATEDLSFTSSLSNTVDVRLALAEEFQTLASLRHPYIISVIDYGFDALKQPYFTMDLLENPQTMFEAAKDQPDSAKIALLSQVLQALAYLHRRGIVHRDLKPGNVLVTNGQVKVLDFGLSVNVGQETVPSGTLAYMAPEVLASKPASIASDLYAVGMIAYELLVGHLPFQTDSITKLMDEILYTSPNLVSVGINSSLAGILDRLLAKVPSERFTSAVEVIQALNAATGLPLPVETESTRESFLQAAKLVGREAELSQLSEMLTGTIKQKGSAYLVSGESGVGKSRLLNELMARALVSGIRVLRGQALSEGGQPYQMWREALRWLALTGLTDLEASVIKPLIPDIADLLGHDVADAPVLDSKAAQTRLLSTIADMFKRNTEPTLILLEDLQWADAESLGLLSWLNRVLPDLALSILANYRDDERPDLSAAFPEMYLLQLKRLSGDEIALLSESVLGEAGRQSAVLDLLQRETEGNVFFLVEVLRTLAEEAGQLDNIGIMTLPAHVFAGGIQRIVRRRLNRVAPSDQSLLRLAAIAGRWLDLGVLRSADPQRDLSAWLTACANAAIIDVQNDRWRFAHDKLREGVMADLDNSQQIELHRQTALAIEAAYPDSTTQSAALAYHWGIAGNTAKEAYYAELAGEQAAASYASEEAMRFLERALALTTDSVRRVALMLKLSEVLEFTGKFAEAETLCREAIGIAETTSETYALARSQKLLGYLLWAKGVFAEALEWSERARSGFEALGKIQELGSTLADMGTSYHDLADYAHALPCYEQCLKIAQNFDDWKTQGVIARRIGNIHLLQANYSLALEYYERALRVAEQIGDRVGASGAINNMGIVYFYQGDYNKSLEYNRKNLQIAIELGQKRGICLNFHNASTIYFEQGEYERALACAGQYLRLSVEIQNRVGFIVGPKAIADVYAAQGESTQAEGLYQLSIKVGRILNSPYYLSDSLLALGELYERQGHHLQARIYNDEALKLATETGSKEIQFPSEILAVRLRFQLHEIEASAALAEYSRLLDTWVEPAQQAALIYEIWRVDKDEIHRQKAAELYRALFGKAPSIKYRKRYEELTGVPLPPAPALPEPSEITKQYPVDFDGLFANIQEIISQ